MSLSGNQKTRLGISTFGVGKSYPFVKNSIIGSLVSTDQDDVMSSVGVIGDVISGTINSTDQDDTTSSTVELKLVGNLSSIDQNDVTNSNSNLVLASELNNTDQDDTSSGSVVLALVVSSNTSDENDIIIGQSYVKTPVNGSINSTDQDDVLSAVCNIVAGSATLHRTRNVQVMKRKNMVVIIN